MSRIVWTKSLDTFPLGGLSAEQWWTPWGLRGRIYIAGSVCKRRYITPKKKKKCGMPCVRDWSIDSPSALAPLVSMFYFVERYYSPTTVIYVQENFRVSGGKHMILSPSLTASGSRKRRRQQTCVHALMSALPTDRCPKLHMWQVTCDYFTHSGKISIDVQLLSTWRRQHLDLSISATDICPSFCVSMMIMRSALMVYSQLSCGSISSYNTHLDHLTSPLELATRRYYRLIVQQDDVTITSLWKLIWVSRCQ